MGGNGNYYGNQNYQQGGQADAGFYKACPEFDTCSEYSNICKHGMVDNMSGYFECTEVESNSGQVAYIAPHCSEDGFTVSLGVYSDVYCNEYIGDGVNIANFIGQEIDPEEDVFAEYYNSAYGATLDQLEYVNEENICIPCKNDDLMWVDRENDNKGDDDQVNDDDGNGRGATGEISELCQNMYQVTARCDKHFRSYKNKSKQAKYAEAIAQEDLTCDFIDSIVMGNYNEMGELDMGEKYNNGVNNEGWWANRMKSENLGPISKVTPLQLLLLIVTIGSVATLALWSMSLQKSLAKAPAWRPRGPVEGSAAVATGELERQSSGIMMGRSMSQKSYYMS